jgi:class 3 adenylate cyclase
MDRPELSNRTWLCTVVFLDMVEYSKRSVAQQMAMKRRFNTQLAEAIAHVAVRDRIVLDTGDGAAICFMGDPEEALLVALRLLHAFRDEAKSELLPMLVRIGIHIGPLKIMKDLNGQLNTIGDGINVAQRIMGFAQSNQILVSRSFYEVVACLSHEYEQLFQYRGARTDKHVREHVLYEVIPSRERNTLEASRPYEASLVQRREEASAPPTEGAPTQSEPTWDPALLERVETALGRHIGPVARVLVKQAAQRTSDMWALGQMLAEHLVYDQERELFLQTMASLMRSSAVPEIPPAPHTVRRDQTDPLGSVPGASAGASPTGWDPKLLQAVQQRLAHYVGPMAKILVQRAAQQTTSLDALHHCLAEHLATAQEKSQFLRESGIPA